MEKILNHGVSGRPACSWAFFLCPVSLCHAGWRLWGTTMPASLWMVLASGGLRVWPRGRLLSFVMLGMRTDSWGRSTQVENRACMGFCSGPGIEGLWAAGVSPPGGCAVTRPLQPVGQVRMTPLGWRSLPWGFQLGPVEGEVILSCGSWRPLLRAHTTGPTVTGAGREGRKGDSCVVVGAGASEGSLAGRRGRTLRHSRDTGDCPAEVPKSASAGSSAQFTGTHVVSPCGPQVAHLGPLAVWTRSLFSQDQAVGDRPARPTQEHRAGGWGGVGQKGPCHRAAVRWWLQLVGHKAMGTAERTEQCGCG